MSIIDLRRWFRGTLLSRVDREAARENRLHGCDSHGDVEMGSTRSNVRASGDTVHRIAGCRGQINGEVSEEE